MDGEQRINNKGTGSETVQWKFEGLATGWYEVSTTWAPAGNYTSEAGFKVFDGEISKGTTLINQRLAPDDDDIEDTSGRKWERLGYYYIENGSISCAVRRLGQQSIRHDRSRRSEGGAGRPPDGELPLGH
ncbi:MAG: hypothetical protein HC898_07760 [Phycisphaerales bacterium]|nr:hypothetical protein [Phycisphaerales bacterium]